MAWQGFETLKVLVVEDNHHMRALLRALLGSLNIRDISRGVPMAPARPGKAAGPQLRILILTDLAMAPMDGLALPPRGAHRASGSNNHFVPIIMITGHTERHRVRGGARCRRHRVSGQAGHRRRIPFTRIAELVEHPRPFVRAEHYFGPDRRRKTPDNHVGPWRRHDDFDDIVIK